MIENGDGMVKRCEKKQKGNQRSYMRTIGKPLENADLAKGKWGFHVYS